MEPPPSAALLEVLAQARLVPSLRLAVHYVLSVAAQRYPRALLPLHARRHEAWALLRTVLEAHSLANHGASFAEHFYFMRRLWLRQPHCALARALRRLSEPRRRLLELLLLVLPEYLSSKLDPLLLDGADEGGGAEPPAEALAPLPPPPSASAPTRGSATWLGAPQRQAASACYRGLRAALELGELVQLVRFLFGRSPHSSLSQQLLGYGLGRAPPSQAPPPSERLATITRLLELPLQHARQLILFSVLGYRLVEWLHAPQHASRPSAPLIPPPPPPPTLPEDSAPSRLEPGVCPLCGLSPLEKPTASPSGFVFCAKCISQAIRRDGRCPLTREPATPDQLLRLFETTRPSEASEQAGRG